MDHIASDSAIHLSFRGWLDQIRAILFGRQQWIRAVFGDPCMILVLSVYALKLMGTAYSDLIHRDPLLGVLFKHSSDEIFEVSIVLTLQL